MRLDQWLWAVRVCKSRADAVGAIKAGHVKVNGALVKPAREPRPGEIVTVRVETMIRTLRVIGAPRSRVGAKLVAQFAEELTPPEEFEKRRALHFNRPAVRPKGSGRPTKRERRVLEEWSGDS